MADAGAPRAPGILTLAIQDKSSLYVAYMPFLKNGGLFIPTNKGYSLNDDVFVLVDLLGERVPVAGKVVWMTPPGAQSKRIQGIGIHFNAKDGGKTKTRIEAILAGSLKSERMTHTM